MRRSLTALVIGVTLLLASGGVGYSQDLEKAWEAYEKGDYATALREYSVLAEQGHAKAQLNLGLMYDNGHGVTRDYKEAVKWYRKSAEQEYALSGVRLSSAVFGPPFIKTGIAHAMLST